MLHLALLQTSCRTKPARGNRLCAAWHQELTQVKQVFFCSNHLGCYRAKIQPRKVSHCVLTWSLNRNRLQMNHSVLCLYICITIDTYNEYNLEKKKNRLILIKLISVFSIPFSVLSKIKGLDSSRCLLAFLCYRKLGKLLTKERHRKQNQCTLGWGWDLSSAVICFSYTAPG